MLHASASQPLNPPYSGEGSAGAAAANSACLSWPREVLVDSSSLSNWPCGPLQTRELSIPCSLLANAAECEGQTTAYAKGLPVTADRASIEPYGSYIDMPAKSL